LKVLGTSVPIFTSDFEAASSGMRRSRVRRSDNGSSSPSAGSVSRFSHRTNNRIYFTCASPSWIGPAPHRRVTASCRSKTVLRISRRGRRTRWSASTRSRSSASGCAPDDARILSTLKVIDAELKVDTPHGPAWHRYQGDGYGEHADGAPFDGIGIGRAWPLLTGERAHYELAAGRARATEELAQALEAFAGDCVE